MNRYEKSQNPGKNELINLAIGLPFLCNPDLIADFLLCNLKNIYRDLIRNGNERDDVLATLGEIPDGLERDVARFINNAVDVMERTGKRKRRSLDDKISGKPHHYIVEAIETAGNVFTRGK